MTKLESVHIPISDNGESIHLDFGCGGSPRNPFKADRLVTVDTKYTSHELPSNIILPGESLPFGDATFTSFSAFDVIEHLSRDQDGKNIFIFYMNELHRILAPGGVGVIIFPRYPYKDAFSDPTHENFATDETLNYFLAAKGGPYYEGITTSYEVIANKRLRKWQSWIYDSQLHLDTSPKSFRRKLSLWKRDVMRFVRPQHQIWLVRKR